MSEYSEYNYSSENPCHTFFYIRDRLVAMLSKDVNKCILDLGCGQGVIANYLISLGYNVYGTDASESGITIARQKNPDRFFIQDLSTGDLPDELKGLKFDTIISTEVIEHLYDPYKFIEFCGNVLAGSNGELIISTPYHGYLKNLVLSIFNKWDGHYDPLWQGGHIKFWSVKSLTRLLNQYSFKVTDFTGCGRLPYLWMSMLVKAKLS